MKNILFLIITVLISVSCKKPIDPTPIDADVAISQNQWELDRYTTPSGQTINNSELNIDAILLYSMYFEFRNDGEVRGVDKSNGNIIQKGVWAFNTDRSSVNVQLATLNHDFLIITLQTGKLTLQAPVDNFLSGLGDQINLEFSAVTN